MGHISRCLFHLFQVEPTNAAPYDPSKSAVSATHSTYTLAIRPALAPILALRRETVALENSAPRALIASKTSQFEPNTVCDLAIRPKRASATKCANRHW
jgi:hypothetical protein